LIWFGQGKPFSALLGIQQTMIEMLTVTLSTFCLARFAPVECDYPPVARFAQASADVFGSPRWALPMVMHGDL